ncbi:MAG: hypothetical protein WAR02_21345 [Pseudolabrys sp.]
MVDDRATQRKKMREQLANLRNAAMAELERRGYDVRGKTPAQIRQILKRGPSKKAHRRRPTIKATNRDQTYDLT